VPGEFLFSYSLSFNESAKEIATRWDHYKFLGGEEVHWISILNTSIINILLSAIVWHIMRKALSRDIEKYKQVKAFFFKKKKINNIVIRIIFI
jgi:transmembrane 9 superfamily protein 2/4